MKKYIGILTLFCFCLNVVAAPKAPSQPKVQTPAKPTAPPPVLVLTPENLRVHLLERNLAILQGLNQVYQAKKGIDVARAQLLPSADLSAALNASGGGFFIPAVTFLLPFLVPSNWFNYEESKYLFEAEKYSYYLLQLNLFASAYNILVTIKGDQELRNIINQKYQNLVKIRDMIQLRASFGMVPKSDLEQATAVAYLAQVELSQVDKLLADEVETVRQMLALPLTEKESFEFTSFTVPPSPFEDKTSVEALDYALKVSPEYKQIENLITASRAGKWSKAFAFMNSSALSIASFNRAPISFSNARVETRFNFSWGYFPALALTNLIIDQLELRRQEIRTEQTQIIASSLQKLNLAKLQVANATQAELGLNKVLEQQTMDYTVGLTDLLHILDTQNSVTEASTARVRSQMDVENLRINLHRAMLMDQFQQIRPCQAKQVKNSMWTEIKNFFGNTQAQKTVDQQCRGTTTKN